MIYDSPTSEYPIDQGDIIEGCPLLQITNFDLPRLVAGDLRSLEIESAFGRVVVVTQTCDLANQKTTVATVARMIEADDLVRAGLLKAADVRGSVRSGRVFGWYFLPASHGHSLPESIVDLRQLHTVPLGVLAGLAREGRRLCRIATPYREHLAQHFATTYGRIGLPLSYETEQEA